MKNYLLFLFVLLAINVTYGQNLNEGFEGTTFPPSGWSVINLGDANTWVRFTSYPRTGLASASITYSATAHNDYLITPQLSPAAGNSTYSFYAESYLGTTYPEQFNVLLSTTGNIVGNFTVTLASTITAPAAYAQFSYDLSAYIGQNVYVAIQAISTNEFYLLIDDVTGPPLTPTSTPTAQPTALILTPAVSSISGSFTAASPVPNGGYLVIASTSSSLSASPVNGVTYTAGQALGGGTVISTANVTTFNASSLSPTTHYYFYIFSYNSGGTGPAYMTTGPLTGNTFTLTATPICGTKTVGATGADFVNLTAAMAALTNDIMTCPVTLLLNSNYSSATETLPIVVPPILGSSATNTLTIKPNVGVTAGISGAIASAPVIEILNNNTIIDGSNSVGGTTQDLTISNTSVSTPQVLVIPSTGTTPLTNITLKNTLIVNGSNTSSAIILQDLPGVTGGYFNNITIQNNIVQNAYIAIYCWAAASAGNGSGLLITGNNLNTSGANAIRLVGIYVQGFDGATLSNNTIGNIVNTLDASNESGIWLATATVNTTISGNTISGLSGTSGAPRGIAVSSAVTGSNILITGNTINNITTTTTGFAAGIYLFSTTAGITISNNFISTIKNTNASGYLATAMYLGSTAAVSAACNVINNAIWDITGYGANSAAYNRNGDGILIYSGFGYNLYHNTVDLNTEQTLATGAPRCIYIYSSVSTAGAIDLRDNIFSTIQTVGTNRYAIYSQAANTVYSNIDYNDYYTTGSNLGYIGSNRANLAAIQAGFGGNVNSLSLNPSFVGTDLHPTNAALMHSGFYLAAVPTDITGAFRPNAPDMGAYQFSTNPSVTTTAASAPGFTTMTVNGTINANNATVTSGFEYGLTTAYGTAVAAIPATVTGSSVTSISAPLSGLIPCTLYHYRAKGISGGMTANGGDMTFTTSNATPTTASTAASLVTATTATVNGTVNANTLSTTVTFDYGLTIAYGTTVPGVPNPVSGSSPSSVSAAITGLLPGVTYHYRVNGTNACGSSSSTDMTFTTLALPPTVVTTAATGVTTTTATLNGIVTANGDNTTVTFDYGLTVAYGTTVPGIPSPVTGNTATNVSASLTGLSVNTTYHYRVNGVNSIGTTNGNDMTFLTVCPVSGAAGPITGPTQACQGGCGYVYTVTIPNATGYVWTIPVGGTITSGANTNTITVCYAANAVSGYVFVYGTAACGNGAPSQLAVNMNPPAAPTIAGPASVCVNSCGNVYSTQVGMSNYIWTVSAGGTITAGGGTTNNTVTICWNTTGAKTVSVNYNTAAGCPALSPTVYNVTVNPLPVPTVAGPNPSCSNFPGIVYSTQTGMNSYVWTISAGGVITAGQGTNAITVTWNATGSQNVTVTYTNANGCSPTTPVVYPVTVNSGAAPTISGTNNLCVNSGYYNYTTESGMTAYNWTISSGGVINYGSGTNVITVSWTATGAQWVKVNYINPAGCTSPNPTQLNITVNPLPGAAGSITGTAAVCGGATGVAYSVATVTGATAYAWTLPSGATIATGANTNAITVNFANNASSGNIIVAANNTCGDGVPSPPFTITVSPLPDAAGTITGQASVCQGATGIVYTVPVINGATSYVWTLPVGATGTSGTTTNSITVAFSASAVSGNITVAGTNSCGNGTVSPNFAVTVNAIPATPVVTNTGTTLYSSAPTGNQWYFEGTLITGATAQTYVATQDGYYWSVVTLLGCVSDSSNHKLILTTGIDSHNSTAINLYPVPNDGRFNVSITTASNETFNISVYNNLGVKIYVEAKVEVNGSLQKVIDLRPVPNGVYTVIFENSLDKVVKKIVVNK
jgi:hypothetical protein